jgi:hypothetical protein
MLKATMETCSSSRPYYQQARWQQFTKMLTLLKNEKLLLKLPIVHNKTTLKIFMELKEFNVYIFIGFNKAYCQGKKFTSAESKPS